MDIPSPHTDFSPVDSSDKPLRIALLIDTSSSWGAGLIEGIVDYAKTTNKRWLFSFELRGKYDRFMLPESWVGHGVIARINHPDLAEQIVARKLPAVNVSWFRYGENLIPTCTCDEEKVAEMAIRYLMDKGHRQFAYCGSMHRPGYYDRLGEAFIHQLDAAGFPCIRFAADKEELNGLDTEQQLVKLAEWLVKLPRPSALLTFDDLQGRVVTEACVQCGLEVPDDIAVLGGEHDELCSRVSSPPLSGVDQSAHEVGYHAAEMLDRQLTGKSMEVTDRRLPPARIISRQSTDKVAIDDDMLAEAIRYIQEHYADEISIRDILHAIPLSRRALEIGFRRHLGRTPRDEIRRIRVQKALELLCDTEWSVTKIASACGFDRPELLTRAFRREFKATPTDFRRRFAHRKPRSVL